MGTFGVLVPVEAVKTDIPRAPWRERGFCPQRRLKAPSLIYCALKGHVKLRKGGDEIRVRWVKQTAFPRPPGQDRAPRQGSDNEISVDTIRSQVAKPPLI